MTETKKLHWTQRPENRDKLMRMVRRGAKANQAKAKKPQKRKYTKKPTPTPNHATNTHPASAIPPEIIAYGLGYVESWLAVFSQSAGVPQSTLAYELGTALRAKGRG